MYGKFRDILFAKPFGFSLIELLVAMSVMTVITTVLIANHARFNSSVLLGSLAYDIALSVREAQVFGLSVREFGSDFGVGYGVRFSDAGDFFLFVDVDQNQAYDDGTDSIVETYTLSRGHFISEFCGYNSSGTPFCSTDATPITHLDIVFNRPNPDAIISSNEPGTYSWGSVNVQASNGEVRTVEIASTGQISVLQVGAASGVGSGGGGGGGGPMFTWQATGGSNCFGPSSPQVTPGADCSPQGAIGYNSVAGACFGFWPRNYTYRCDP